MKRSFTLLLMVIGMGTIVNAQTVTPLLTGETSPEAITYYDFVEWSIADAGKIPTWYVDFGTGGPFTQFVDNPDATGINQTAKSLYMATTTGVDWWGNFLNFRLETPLTITEDNRYLHFFHWRENLNNGWSISLNANEPLEDADKGTLRFDGNNTSTGQWEDIVIDLKYLMDEGIAFEKFMVIVDKDWEGERDNPATKYYFDEIILSSDPLQRGVDILEGTDILNAQDQAQLDALVFSTQNDANTWEVVDNPFTDSWLNADGKVVKFFKSDQASWWQGFNVSFPGIHVLEYGVKQYMHVLVRTDTTCYIQLHAVDNLGKEFTEMFIYPMDEIDGDWFDLVWDLTSVASTVKAFTVRFDVRMDSEENYINNTPARDFYVDEITIDGIEDPREGTDPSIGVEEDKLGKMHFYAYNRTIFFDMPGAEMAEVYDVLGKRIASRQLDRSAGLNSISVPQEGIYILRVKADHTLSTAKVLVK
jgi:hypothetical protein